jgi:iron complex transport system ATP-binding protein
MAQPPVIELDRVSYRQQSTDILTDVSWRLADGERWAVLGPNGCGKTTLLRVACGYVWPISGTVRRLGQELLDLGELRRTIGWVTADLTARIPPEERAVETVVSGKFAQTGLKRLGDAQPSEDDLAVARDLLVRMGSSALADKPFGVLSQGERQQVLVARARIVDPVLIVLDEPCAGMDPGVRERFLAWLDGAAASGALPAIVFVTHHVEEIMPSFDRTLVMRAGRIAVSGATRDVLTAELLSEVYGVTVDRLERFAGRVWPVWAAT